MKIALFCSSRNIIPTKKTGGTEQPIFYLAKGLAEYGHEVTLYAAKGSKVPGVKVCEISPFITCVRQKYLNIQERIASFYDIMALSVFFKNEADRFDIIQFNSYMFYEILPFAKFTKTPIIIRINYPHSLIYPYIKHKIKKIQNVYYLPISKFIKSAMPGLNYLDPIYPAIDISDFKFSNKPGMYLLSIGRICHNKGVHAAIEVAKNTKEKLIIAGRLDQENGQDYFDKEIKPHIDNKQIKYIGEVDFNEKIKLYQNAKATLFPILWDEPFGNVQIESMACGTPVIAFDRAAEREALLDKKSGYIVNNKKEMVEAVRSLNLLERKKVRDWIVKKFNIHDSLRSFEKMYNEIQKKA